MFVTQPLSQFRSLWLYFQGEHRYKDNRTETFHRKKPRDDNGNDCDDAESGMKTLVDYEAGKEKEDGGRVSA